MCVFVKIVLFEQKTINIRTRHPYIRIARLAARLARAAAASAVAAQRHRQRPRRESPSHPSHRALYHTKPQRRQPVRIAHTTQMQHIIIIAAHTNHINRANHIHTRSTHARTSTKTQAGAHHKHIPYTPSYYSHETEMGAVVVSSAAELDTDVGDVFCGIRCDGGAPLCDAEPIPSSLSASSSLCSCAASRMEIMFVWPKCLARSIADLPSLSLRSGSAPASTRHLQAVSSPFETAQCSGVQPTVVVFCREHRRERV